ncbi:MAG: hypothetical protein NVSMB48_09900 [Marmoricola sp.]
MGDPAPSSTGQGALANVEIAASLSTSGTAVNAMCSTSSPSFDVTNRVQIAIVVHDVEA